MKEILPLLLLMAACTPTPSPHSEAAHNRKVMALQEKFDRFDYDGNGRMSRAEIEQGIRESGVKGVTKEEIDAVMKHYDVNDDGEISRWETERAIQSPLPSHR